MNDHKHNEDNCHCITSAIATQSLTEMAFDRGIWSAALYNDIDRLKVLIRRGQTNDRDETGYTALHYAARSNDMLACQLLIDANAHVNAVTHGGVTPLQRAAMMGHLDVVKLLLNHNADAGMQDNDGNNAAHRAAMNGHLNVLNFLLEKDKNISNTFNNKGLTPLNIVKSSE